MQKTRKHILDYLDQQRSASALELSKAFGITVANIRYHLAILEEQGQVQMIGEQALGGRGRPEKRFAINFQSDSGNVLALTRALLKQIGESVVNKSPKTRLRKLAKEIGGPKIPKSLHFTQRLVESIKSLDEMGYRPSWEARPGGPQITLGQCPYALIIVAHPELCQMDAYLLEHLAGEKMVQSQKLVVGAEGLPICTFIPRDNQQQSV